MDLRAFSVDVSDKSSSKYLEYLSAVEKVFLVFAREAHIISHTCPFKVSYIDAP